MMGAMRERDLEGTSCLITGANTGIGYAAARDLAERGARVAIACRSEEKGRAAARAIRSDTGNDEVDLLVVDLAELSSVRSAAERFQSRGQPLNVLINNAGVAGQRGLTRDGFELAFGVNHLAHFLLTHLLLDTLRESAPARVVNVSSKSHYSARAIDWNAVTKPTKTFTGLREYSVSKLANVLHAAELARRLAGQGVTTYAVHPGVIASDIWRRIPFPFRNAGKLFMRSNEQGGQALVHCAASPETAEESGLYYHEGRRQTPSRAARDPDLAAELWRRSASFCGVTP